MTPGIELAKRQNIAFRVHEYTHNPNAASYGLEAVEKLNLDPQRVFKTLVVELSDKSLAVAVLPVEHSLSMKLMAKAVGLKKASMAAPEKVERATAYVLGGVSPLGQKQRLVTVIHDSAQGFESIFVSAGRRGLEIELSANDLAACTKAKFAKIV